MDLELLNKTRDAIPYRRSSASPTTGTDDGRPRREDFRRGRWGQWSAGRRQRLRAGFGLSATPAGVYVLKDDKVSWQPAVDVNRVVLGGQLVALVALLVLRSLVRARARRG